MPRKKVLIDEKKSEDLKLGNVNQASPVLNQFKFEKKPRIKIEFEKDSPKKQVCFHYVENDKKLKEY